MLWHLVIQSFVIFRDLLFVCLKGFWIGINTLGFGLCMCCVWNRNTGMRQRGKRHFGSLPVSFEKKKVRAKIRQLGQQETRTFWFGSVLWEMNVSVSEYPWIQQQPRGAMPSGGSDNDSTALLTALRKGKKHKLKTTGQNSSYNTLNLRVSLWKKSGKITRVEKTICCFRPSLIHPLRKSIHQAEAIKLYDFTEGHKDALLLHFL